MMMPRRLFNLVTLMLTALLPLEASIAASGCLGSRADTMAMTNHDLVAADMTGTDCDDGAKQSDDFADNCAVYCLALCQMVPSIQASQPPKTDAATEHGRFPQPSFRLSGPAGPEPPPPRLAD